MQIWSIQLIYRPGATYYGLRKKTNNSGLVELAYYGLRLFVRNKISKSSFQRIFLFFRILANILRTKKFSAKNFLFGQRFFARN